MAQQRKSKSQSEWAKMMWDELTHQAKRGKTLDYTELGQLVGYNNPQFGPILAHIFYFCKLRRLPPLTVLVKNRATGLPGSGMGEFTPADFDAVYNYDWERIPTPTAKELEDAYRQGNGLSNLTP